MKVLLLRDESMKPRPGFFRFVSYIAKHWLVKVGNVHLKSELKGIYLQNGGKNMVKGFLDLAMTK